MANRIVLNETSYFGWGAREVLPEEIKKRKFKKALFVTDQMLLSVGIAKKVIDLLDIEIEKLKNTLMRDVSLQDREIFINTLKTIITNTKAIA